MIGSRKSWLSWAGLLLASFAFAAAALVSFLPQLTADVPRLVKANPNLLAVLLGVPLLPLLLYLWSRWELEAGGPSHSTGELNTLVLRKRRGLLPRGIQRSRRSGAPLSRFPPRASHPSDACGELPQSYLDRLVQQKRSGAWSSAG
jgi:hypothetical protein